MASWTNLPKFQVQTSTSVARMDQLLDNITVLASHVHDGVGGQGASSLGAYSRGTKDTHTTEGVELSIHAFLPSCQLNWSRVSPCPQAPFGGYLKTDSGVSASGACVVYDVVVPGPTATQLRVQFGAYRDSNSGCIAACIGGSPLTLSGASTQSLYSAAPASAGAAWNVISGQIASGVKEVKIKVVGQSTCSGGYHAGLSHITVTQ